MQPLMAAQTKMAADRNRRGPNAARRSATRAKLLEATVACLHELGYHRTTTTLVQERAGVSRGSLLHQFPSRVDLMIGAAEHIAKVRGQAHLAALENTTPGPGQVALLVDILWGQVSSPSGIARLELLLASRSDPELAYRLAALNAHLDERHRDAIWRMAQAMGVGARAPIDALVQLYAAALRGLAVDALFADAQSQIEAAVAMLKRLMIEVVAAEIAQASLGRDDRQDEG